MVEPEWLGVGVALVLATIAAAWRFAGLRADMSEKWGERIDVAKAGLSEHATAVLRSMEGDIAELLGTGGPFNPLDVVKDPAALKAQAKDFLKLIRLRDRADSRYRLLLSIGPVGFVSAVLFGIGIIPLFLDLANLVAVSWTSALGRWLAVVFGSILALDLGGYAYLQHYLSNVDVESRS